MSLRDIIVALFILGSLPLCFRRPFVGLLLFSVLAYMRLQDLTWGFAREQRWSLLVATVMVAGWFAAREKYPPVLSLRTGLLSFLVLWIGLGHFFAHGDAPIEWVGYIEYAKIVFIAIFTTSCCSILVRSSNGQLEKIIIRIIFFRTRLDLHFRCVLLGAFILGHA